MSYQLITEVNHIQTSETDWWMIYDPVNLAAISSPMQCSGYTSSPHNMVIADTEAEALEFIIDNDIKPFTEEELPSNIEENGLIIPVDGVE
jgi:hypothetical protein